MHYPYKTRAKYSFESAHEEDLFFAQDQEIFVVGKEDEEWLQGYYNISNGGRKYGIFPKSFVEPIFEEDQSEINDKPENEKSLVDGKSDRSVNGSKIEHTDPDKPETSLKYSKESFPHEKGFRSCERDHQISEEQSFEQESPSYEMNQKSEVDIQNNSLVQLKARSPGKCFDRSETAKEIVRNRFENPEQSSTTNVEESTSNNDFKSRIAAFNRLSEQPLLPGSSIGDSLKVRNIQQFIIKDNADLNVQQVDPTKNHNCQVQYVAEGSSVKSEDKSNREEPIVKGSLKDRIALLQNLNRVSDDRMIINSELPKQKSSLCKFNSEKLNDDVTMSLHEAKEDKKGSSSDSVMKYDISACLNQSNSARSSVEKDAKQDPSVKSNHATQNASQDELRGPSMSDKQNEVSAEAFAASYEKPSEIPSANDDKYLDGYEEEERRQQIRARLARISGGMNMNLIFGIPEKTSPKREPSSSQIGNKTVKVINVEESLDRSSPQISTNDRNLNFGANDESKPNSDQNRKNSREFVSTPITVINSASFTGDDELNKYKDMGATETLDLDPVNEQVVKETFESLPTKLSMVPPQASVHLPSSLPSHMRQNSLYTEMENLEISRSVNRTEKLEELQPHIGGNFSLPPPVPSNRPRIDFANLMIKDERLRNPLPPSRSPSMSSLPATVASFEPALDQLRETQDSFYPNSSGSNDPTFENQTGFVDPNPSMNIEKSISLPSAADEFFASSQNEPNLSIRRSETNSSYIQKENPENLSKNTVTSGADTGVGSSPEQSLLTDMFLLPLLNRDHCLNAPTSRNIKSSAMDSKLAGSDKQEEQLSQAHVHNKFKARTIELKLPIGWWITENGMPVDLQNLVQHEVRIQNLLQKVSKCDQDEPVRSSIDVTKERILSVLYSDYSILIVSVIFNSQTSGALSFNQKIIPPPEIPSKETLLSYSELSKRLYEYAKTIIGKRIAGSESFDLIESCFAAVPQLVPPVGTKAFGSMIYDNLGNSSIVQSEEIRSGDIVVFKNAHFHGHRGSLKQKYDLFVGKPESFAVVSAWEGDTRKLRVLEQRQSKVSPEKYRLSDLRSGEVLIWRPCPHEWLSNRQFTSGNESPRARLWKNAGR